MKPIEPFALEGRRVRLLPFSTSHVAALVAAASESRESFALTHVPTGEAAMRAYVEAAIALRAQGNAVPFVTVDVASARVVGATRFGMLEYWTWPVERAPVAPSVDFEAAEIGWTWLAPSAQRTHVNTEAKLLMLTHAFETWRLRRVNLKTDARNARSRAAIERIGARLDGVLRSHGPAWDGGVRNTAMYSILAAEWPAAKIELARRAASG